MRSDAIKITPDLDIKFEDLMRRVDFDHEFRLMDVLRAVVSSSQIPVPIMGAILQCPCVGDYWKEAQSKPFEDAGDIEYLELSFSGDIWEDRRGHSKRTMTGFWGFGGVGRAGVIPEDLIKNEVVIDDKENFRQGYAIEFSEMWKLSGYQVRISQSMAIERYGKKRGIDTQNVDFAPSMTLVEVLYYIFWELSFCGCIDDRSKKLAELNHSVEEFEKAKADGTLKTFSLEDLMKEEFDNDFSDEESDGKSD